jgi:hypothetical protein
LNSDDKNDDSAKTIKIINKATQIKQFTVPLKKRMKIQKRQQLLEKTKADTICICKIDKF